MEQFLARLAAQDILLEQILSAVQPAEQASGSGLDDLIEALTALQFAVAAQGVEIRALRSTVFGGYLHGEEAA